MVVRSDDVDGYDILGTATLADRVWRFRATARDDGTIVSSEVDEAGSAPPGT